MENLILLATDDKHVINLFHQINKEYKFGFLIEAVDKKYLLKEDLSFKLGTIAVLLDLDEMMKLTKDVVLQQLAKKKITIPLVVVKSRYDDLEMRSLFKNGVFDCLSKPFDEEVVYRLLQELKVEAQLSDQMMQQRNEDPHNIMSSVRLGLIYNLLYGNIKNSREIWDQSQLVGLSTMPNTAMSLQIDEFFLKNKEKSKQWQDFVRNEIITVTRQFFMKKLDECLAMGTAADKFAILLSFPFFDDHVGFKQYAKKISEEAKTYIKENTGYSVTIGIGNYYKDVRNLHLSYQEAQTALKHKFFLGKDLVIPHDDVVPFTNEFVLLPNQDVSTLASKLMVADNIAVSDNMKNLLDRLFSLQNVDPEVLKLQLSEISTMLARAAINGGANEKEIHFILSEYTSSLNFIENLVQLEQWIRNLIHRFIDLVSTKNNDHTLKSIQKAMEYIEQHYLEQITLEKVSSHVHLSPTYFSRIFKSATGTNFVEYITYLRIEKAKELLKDLNYTVYQIAFEVGYSNSHYFSRVFKTLVGKTPSEYRNSILVPSGNSTEGLFERKELY
ncbi:helix-turn-helix domain-containing protein [Neobacillus cucumis]|uniref:helix-turn-helix domain-containing protein n=1 Tax=Neobacillus cucumis TaxID=1740721 RepID=UPI0018DFA8FE|nr:helix-turn-helix domain-containing protein [Neobacillus cucumis]MBI0576158.1 helix-turn-helix domain-containing protein [Neobacillus cucumis]